MAKLTTREVFSIGMLSQDSVTVYVKNVVDINGKEVPIGSPTTIVYNNSVEDRQIIQEKLPNPYLSSVMMMWGDEPTIKDNTDEDQSVIQ